LTDEQLDGWRALQKMIEDSKEVFNASDA